ncbi:helix-turn-helix domain-containing protein [Hymenobacter properus]|uniref:AraC family transcriptional regulator n=1 Tax=Hymenobacter properus TaxID=2791026 RepID=A0A931BFW8_9BACT|nr:helix-turn-helix domain-containing protein [Hymenobacter properus]MBF9140921.1 AraC family transcriptional regulator [Hymenobacter properus]MBR7719730.1 AraC family transcriptional regulator [Microvirga sp. SRT04]
MAYTNWQAFEPLPALRHVVDHYWAFEPVADGEVMRPQVVLPSPTPALFFRCAAAPGQPAADWLCRPASYQRLELRCSPGTGLLGITFHPTGFYRLFGLSMTRAAEAGPALAGRAGAFVRALAAQLASVRTAAAHAAVAEALLLAETGPDEWPTALEALAAGVLQRHGQVSIDQLAAGAHLCRRQFERRFREVVGVAPKLFAEISRFRYVVEQLQAQPLVNWQDVTHQCGYYDQAHLIRDFRRFTGRTPASYFLQERQVRAKLLPENQ